MLYLTQNAERGVFNVRRVMSQPLRVNFITSCYVQSLISGAKTGPWRWYAQATRTAANGLTGDVTGSAVRLTVAGSTTASGLLASRAATASVTAPCRGRVMKARGSAERRRASASRPTPTTVSSVATRWHTF